MASVETSCLPDCSVSEHVLELFEVEDYEQLAEHVLGSEGYLPWLLKPDFSRLLRPQPGS